MQRVVKMNGPTPAALNHFDSFPTGGKRTHAKRPEAEAPRRSYCLRRLPRERLGTSLAQVGGAATQLSPIVSAFVSVQMLPSTQVPTWPTVPQLQRLLWPKAVQSN